MRIFSLVMAISVVISFISTEASADRKECYIVTDWNGGALYVERNNTSKKLTQVVATIYLGEKVTLKCDIDHSFSGTIRELTCVDSISTTGEWSPPMLQLGNCQNRAKWEPIRCPGGYQLKQTQPGYQQIRRSDGYPGVAQPIAASRPTDGCCYKAAHNIYCSATNIPTNPIPQPMCPPKHTYIAERGKCRLND